MLRTSSAFLVPALALGLALAAAPSVAHAQGSPALLAKAEAAALFDKGLRAFEAGRFAEALTALERSYELDPALGTLLYLADCHAQLGHTASAWAAFRSAVAMATRTNDRRAKAAGERAAELEKSLPYVTIRPAPGGPSDQEIRRDGQIVAAASWGVAVPVDPGPHVIEITAAGRKPVRRELRVAAGEKAVVDLAPLVDATAPPPAVTPEPSPKRPPPPPADAPPSTATRTVGYGAVGVGLLAGAIGGYVWITKTSEANDAKIRADYDDAASARRTGMIVAGVGGALAVAGVVTIALSPKPEHTVRLQPAPGVFGARLTGSF